MCDVAEGRGTAKVVLQDSQGVEREALLENALFIPSFQQNIFSVQCAADRGASVRFSKHAGGLEVGGVPFPIHKLGNLYYLNSALSSHQAKHSLETWHEILGHLNKDDVIKIESCLLDASKQSHVAKSFHCQRACAKLKVTESNVTFVHPQPRFGN